ncbi:Os04g0621900 [Oryza sativa Japonica Group]|uniref:Os04g0621900 protein n=1 Tax=Oryza sativa subsp. japonica TaxID=39947 RepID=A0A0P0WEV2_ORYSJ|nr:Os04g0621900 [Oryza sativa Japonica Group]
MIWTNIRCSFLNPTIVFRFPLYTWLALYIFLHFKCHITTCCFSGSTFFKEKYCRRVSYSVCVHIVNLFGAPWCLGTMIEIEYIPNSNEYEIFLNV